jgi:hypothetical protein
VGKASVAQWQQAIIHQEHFAKIWEMAVLLIFLPQFLSILSNLALAKIGPRFWQYSRSGRLGPINQDQADQSGPGPINRDWARPDQIRPDRESILAMLPIKDPILVMCRLATMPKNGVLLLCRACPDEPDNCKYEYYYVSYSY